MTWLKLVNGKHYNHVKDGPALLIYQAWEGLGLSCPERDRTWVQLLEIRDVTPYTYVINKCIKGARSDIDEVFTDKQQAIEATKAIAGLIGAVHLVKGEQYEYQCE